MSAESVPPLAEVRHDLEGMPVEAPELTGESLACMTCGMITPGTHYLVSGQRTCETCASQVPVDESTRLGRFSRALIFGTVAATLCAALWYAVMTITGYELGLIALIVGLVVGVAVRLGSKERGGWVYQGMAVALTYLAIVSTYVPVLVEALGEGIVEEGAAPGEVDAAEEAGGVPPPTAVADPVTPDTEPPRALLYAVAIPLAVISPVLVMFDDFAASLMWLIIIGVALFEAWKVNQGNGARVVEGPVEPFSLPTT